MNTDEIEGDIQTNNKDGLSEKYIKAKDAIQSAIENEYKIQHACEEDKFARLLMPQTTTAKPLKTTGDGNCLFHATSISLIGNETLSPLLRQAVAIEIFLHGDTYDIDNIVQKTLLHKDAILSQHAYKELITSSKSGNVTMKTIALETLQPNEWCSLLHMIAISSFLGTDIESVYPECNTAIRPLFNQTLRPQHTSGMKCSQQIKIMWSRDGTFDNSPSVPFQPNHFVPLVETLDFCEDLPEDVINAVAEMCDQYFSEKDNTRSKEKPIISDDELLLTSKGFHEIKNSSSQSVKQTESINNRSVTTCSTLDRTESETHEQPISEIKKQDKDILKNEPQHNLEPGCIKVEVYDEDLPLSNLKVQVENCIGDKVKNNSTPQNMDKSDFETEDEQPLSYLKKQYHLNNNSPQQQDFNLKQNLLKTNTDEESSYDTEDNTPLANLLYKNNDKSQTKQNEACKEKVDLSFYTVNETQLGELLGGANDSQSKQKTTKNGPHKEIKELQSNFEDQTKSTSIPSSNQQQNAEWNEDPSTSLVDETIEDDTMIYESDYEDDLICGDSTSSSSEENDVDPNNDAESISWVNKLFEKRKNDFCGPPPGSKHTFPATNSLLNFFYLFFPEQLFSKMQESTNEYVKIYEASKRKHFPNWSDPQCTTITEEEIKAYLGIRMIMAIDQKTNIEDYWSTDPALKNVYVSQTMSRQKFRSVQRYLHIADPTKDPSRMKSTSTTEVDPLYKVRPLIDHVQTSIKTNYNLHREVAVDEAMIKCNAQHWGTVGAPNKPAKHGFKVFVLSDSVTGYMSNFQIYLRKEKEMGLTQRVVENLTEDIKGFNHIVFMDKFYTSVPLATSLLQSKIYMCGSFNTGRKMWPPKLKENKKKRKKEDPIRNLQRGDYRTMQSGCGNYVATVWQDTKLVTNLTTFYTPITNVRKNTVERRIRKKKGGWTTTSISCPPSIIAFNKFMGGVDRHDHLRANYTLQRQSTRWWTYFLWFAIDVCLVDAYIIYKESGLQPMSHKKFHMKLAKQLVGGFCQRSRTAKQMTPPEITAPMSHECVVCPGERPRMCMQCKVMGVKTAKGNRIRETNYKCQQCNINLHRECFMAYHEGTLKSTISNKRSIDTQTEELQNESADLVPVPVKKKKVQLRRSPRKLKK